MAGLEDLCLGFWRVVHSLGDELVSALGRIDNAGVVVARAHLLKSLLGCVVILALAYRRLVLRVLHLCGFLFSVGHVAVGIGLV